MTDVATSDGVCVRPARYGSGLYATRAYAVGQPIVMLTGEILDGPALEATGYRPGYPLQIGHDLWMLLDEPVVFVNHSCAPNAGIDPQLQLVAIAPIQPGDELTFDYSTTMQENDAWTLQCGCGEPNCRGTVGDFRRLPEATRRDYISKGVVLPFLIADMG